MPNFTWYQTLVKGAFYKITFFDLFRSPEAWNKFNNFAKRIYRTLLKKVCALFSLNIIFICPPTLQERCFRKPCKCHNPYITFVRFNVFFPTM